VFAPDPFDAVLRGRAAIEAYWRDVPLNQSEIAFRVGEVFTVGPWFAAEFRCTFRRRRTGEPVDLRGALFCETTDGLVSEMRMYHHRRVRESR
jgi:ketosteroid isomerase-like protein